MMRKYGQPPNEGRPTGFCKKNLGFMTNQDEANRHQTEDILKAVQPEDLLKFGLIPEFIGRIPYIISLTPLDKEALIRILTEPKNALVKQYEKLLLMDGVKLTFTEEAFDTIAEEALKRQTGARGLRAILEKVMMDVMFEAPSDEKIKEIRVTKEAILGVSSVEKVYE